MKYRIGKALLAAFAMLTASHAQAQTVGEEFTESRLTFRVLTVDAKSQTGTVEIIKPVGTLEGTLQIGAYATTNMSGDIWNFAITSIADGAFSASAITELDLSQATSLKHIGALAFSDCTSLETVIFPPFEVSCLTGIDKLAFHHALALKYMNLEDTRISVLEPLFSEGDDAITIEGLTSLQLPKTLTEVRAYALQCLDIREIEFPSGITVIGDCSLRACIYLRNFTWKDAQVTSIPRNTFRYNDKLETVTIFTVKPLETDGLKDIYFQRYDGQKTMVYVSKESYDQIIGNYYTEGKGPFSELVADPNWTSDIKTFRVDGTGATLTDNVISGDVFYSLQGIKVNKPIPGQLYIHRGRVTVFRVP